MFLFCMGKKVLGKFSFNLYNDLLNYFDLFFMLKHIPILGERRGDIWNMFSVGCSS